VHPYNKTIINITNIKLMIDELKKKCKNICMYILYMRRS
jgi:hypothetical protein